MQIKYPFLLILEKTNSNLMDDLIGKTISRYKILHRIGEGGMGVLYIAEDLELNRKAVLKFLPPDMMDDPETNLRFKREAQAAGSVSHPNIVTIYDVGVHENKTFIAMEYVEGKTLRELIKSDELTIERITDISIQVCEGLNEAHSKGITHRDIKPENILLDEKGKVKIVDFGLAKVKNVSKDLTKASSTLGTIKYMSPEQIRNQKVDQRTDIWSFGVILYEMITGRYPFKGEHDASLFYSIINQSPEPLARYKTDIAEGFQRIIDKALDKDPGTRYQHIDEVLSDLRREGTGRNSNKKKFKKLSKRISFISAAVLFIIIIALAANYFLAPSKIIKPPKHTQLTFEGNIYSINNITQISPDGLFTAFVVDKGNKKNICIKDNSGEQVIEIFHGLQSVFDLRWSPTGREIFFVGYLDSLTPHSFIIPRFGGHTQEIPFDSYGCWSPDENIIATIGNARKTIRYIKRNTNEIIKTIQLKGSFNWLDAIDWSFQNKLLLLAYDDQAQRYSILIINSDGSGQRKILEGDKIIYSPRWSNDGNYIYYLQANDLTSELMKINASTDNLENLPNVLQTGILTSGFSITRDNKKLCYTKNNIFSNIWKLSYNGKNKNISSKKLTQGTSLFKMPRISRNSKEIVCIQNGNIFKMSSVGDSYKQLTFLKSVCLSPSWSPNDKDIAFIATSNLYSIPSNGGPISTLKKNKFNSEELFWQLNTEIYYNKPGNRNFFIYNPATYENKLLVTNEDIGWMFNPRLAPDYKNLAVFWNRKKNKFWDSGLWLISLSDSSQRLIQQEWLYPFGWSEDSKWIYAISSDNITPQNIKMISKNTGKTNLIYTLHSGKINPYYDIDISSDGKTIVTAIQETNSDVWMIENFDPDVE